MQEQEPAGKKQNHTCASHVGVSQTRIARPTPPPPPPPKKQRKQPSGRFCVSLRSAIQSGSPIAHRLSDLGTRRVNSPSGTMLRLKLKGQMAMGQNPNRAPSEHPNPTTKIGSNGWCTYPKMGSQNGFDNHSQIEPKRPTSSDSDLQPVEINRSPVHSLSESPRTPVTSSRRFQASATRRCRAA